MKKFFRLLLFCGGIYMITVANSNPDPFGPTPNPNTIDTVYIGCFGIGGNAIIPINVTVPPGITNFDTHVGGYFDKLEEFVTIPYWLDNNGYIEGGVSLFNCADHDHQEQISRNDSSGVWSLTFQHDTQIEGTVWLQFVSQCEDLQPDGSGSQFGTGIYYKGEEWYDVGTFPLVHNQNILIEEAILTDCEDPFPSEEYGCGDDDAGN